MANNTLELPEGISQIGMEQDQPIYAVYDEAGLVLAVSLNPLYLVMLLTRYQNASRQV